MRRNSHVAGWWPVIVAVAALAVPGARSWAQSATQPDWMAPLTQAAWVAQPSWLANPAAADQQSAAVVEGVTGLRVAAPSRGMKWSWTLPVPAALEGLRYAGMRYRARGISPRGHYALCLIG
ncbi:MAG: hypothetical protein NT154_35650, partial [Verrucomicrobia bacterium]|nr:hypothetical protein [Verrucomicrobiota bacterium]